MSVREAAEDYGRVVARLGERDRLIEAADGMQWVWQRRTGRAGRVVWHSRMWFRSRSGVALHLSEQLGDLPGAGELAELLARLPEWFAERRGRRAPGRLAGAAFASPACPGAMEPVEGSRQAPP
jgi:hypothetical protein